MKHDYNKILIVEDEKSLLYSMVDYFEASGFDVTYADDGKKAFELMYPDYYDLIILDIMLPNINGFELCRIFREKDRVTPIFFLTALSSETEQLSGLDYGATDYIIKPFSLPVLVKKCERTINLYRNINDDYLSVGPILVSMLNREMVVGENTVKLDKKEYQLLKFFALHPNILLSRTYIYNAVWGEDCFSGERVLDTYVKNLRKKMGDYGTMIKTVVKEGYIFEITN